MVIFLQNEIKNNPNIVNSSNKVYYGIDSSDIKPHHSYFLNKEIIFPLKKIKFEDTEFYIPNQVENFMKFECPNWRDFPKDIGFSHHNYGRDLILKQDRNKRGIQKCMQLF